jgi:VPDSG-CTERM motif
MKHNRYYSVLGLIVSAFFFIEAPICRANLMFDVNLDTRGLIGHPAGPFYIDFQLNDGRGTGDANNMVTINNFMFADGNAVGSPLPSIGGASGSLFSSVSITDSGFVNEFTQQFNPGDTLSFSVVLLTTNLEPPGFPPDAFSFSILDSLLSPIPTTNFADAFIFININSKNLTTANLGNSIFAGDPNQPPLAGGDVISIGAPRIPGVPDTGSSISMLLIGLGAVWCFRRRFVNLA